MGSSPQAPPDRNLSQELGGVFSTFNKQELPNFNNYAANQPLLAGSSNLALLGQSQLPYVQGNLKGAIDYLNPIVQSGGALTTEQKNLADQQAEAGFAQRGNLYGNQSVAGDLLNRDQYRQQRFNTALGQESGLLSQYQGAIGQAINPALQTQNAAVGEYASLINPLLNYGSDLYNTNYNAQAASNIAGSNKSSGAVGGGLSALGSIAGAAGIAL